MPRPLEGDAPAETGANVETTVETPAPACRFMAKFAWPFPLKAELPPDTAPASVHRRFAEPRKRIRAALEKLPGVQSVAVTGGAVEIPDVGPVSQKTMVTLELEVPLGPEANGDDLTAAGRAFQERHLVPALRAVPEVGDTVAIGSMKKR